MNNRRFIQLLIQLEEHLDMMDNTQIKNYRKLCRSLQVEPKPLQCIKPPHKSKYYPLKSVKRKNG